MTIEIRLNLFTGFINLLLTETYQTWMFQPNYLKLWSVRYRMKAKQLLSMLILIRRD